MGQLRKDSGGGLMDAICLVAQLVAPKCLEEEKTVYLTCV